MSTNSRRIKKRTLVIVSTIMAVLICLASISVIAIFAKENTKSGLLFGCSFNNSLDDEKGNSHTEKGTSFYNNSLRINNEHRAGNSVTDASSYVEYKAVNGLSDKDFTISFNYYAHQPTDTYSTIISTGLYGEGLNIFNKNGLGISFGKYVMKSDSLSEAELKRGSVRLDYNIINDGKSHDVLITCKRKEDIKLYIDGFFINKITLSPKEDTIENTTFIIGADSMKKWGSEDMFIKDLRIYDSICDKNGETLFDEYKWLVAERKANKVLKDYKGLATESSLTDLADYLRTNKPLTSEDVDVSVKGVNDKINAVITSAKTKERFNFQILSDTHMNGSNNGPKNKLIDALNNIDSWFNDNSALVVTGDLTDNGYESQYDQYYEALRTANKSPYTMNITGNHESSYNDTPISEDNQRFLRYENSYRKDNYKNEPQLDKVYYDKWINGCHFIGLASEDTLTDGGYAYLSPEQLQFLRDKLKEAEPGKEYNKNQPIFVFCHQPLNDTTFNSSELGLGPNSDEVKSIFAEYPQVIYVSGHTHNGYVGAEGSYNAGFGTLMDMPCLRANEVVRYDYSIGYTVSVYNDNKVIFTPVNFTDDDILYDMSVVIDDHSRFTLTDRFDYKDVKLSYDGREITNRNLVDNLESTYLKVDKDKELVFTLNEVQNISGLRLGTKYYTKLNKLSIAFSTDGVTFTEYKDYTVMKGKTIQKIMFNENNIKKIKVKFDGKDTISTLVPTVA